MSRYRRLCAALALGAAVLVGACGEDDGGPAARAPKAKGSKAAAQNQAAETPPPVEQHPFAYSPVGKRDPFRSYLADLAENQRSTATRKSEETERYELDQYRLTGLVTGTSQPRAMVEDPDGQGHVLHIGSHLGKRGGRVTRIGPDSIVVTEEMRAPTGELVRIPITIKLPAPDLQLEVEP